MASGSVAAARAASAAVASALGRVSVISIWICSATRAASPARQTCQPMKMTMTATRIASAGPTTRRLIHSFAMNVPKLGSGGV